MKRVTDSKSKFKRDIQILSKQELKKAIVLSEILGKPKAQKKRSL